jgi:hypothetical protein
MPMIWLYWRMDGKVALQPGDQGGGRHPAGAAAADNDDAVKFL